MAQAHPYKFTTSMLSLAQESGAQLITGRVTSLNASSISYVTDNGSRDIPADTIIVAVGPWTPSLLPSIPISTCRAHSIVIEPTRPLPPQAVFFEYDSATGRMSPELYSRPTSVYICGSSDSRHGLPVYSKDVIALESSTSQLERFAKEISTPLAEGRVITRQACYLPIHERGFPVIGWVVTSQKGRAGVFVAAGHAVWGISLAPGTGKVVAEMVIGGNKGKGEEWDVTKLAP